MRTASGKKAPSLAKRICQYRTSYVMLAPFMLIFFTFTVVPVIATIGLSFTQFNVLEMPKFIGLDNFKRLFFVDDLFGTAVNNTLIFAIVTGPVSYFLCFVFAWMINDLPKHLRSFMTLVFYAPSISGALFTIWLIIFDGDIYGYLNSFLMNLGFISQPIQWLTDVRTMMGVVVVVQLWVSLGTSFLTMRAGFSTIDRQYYEAGAVDGLKNRWQELWYITIPMMSPHLMLSAVLSITAAFNSYNVAVSMTGFPSTNYATYSIMHMMIDYGTMRYERGYACAIATILFFTCLIINRLVQRALRKVGE